MKRLDRYQRIILLSLVFFVVMMVVAVFHEDGVLTVYEFQTELERLEENNAALKQENAELRKSIEALKTDPFPIEKIAREKLDLARPGETIYRIVPSRKDPPKENFKKF